MALHPDFQITEKMLFDAVTSFNDERKLWETLGPIRADYSDSKDDVYQVVRIGPMPFTLVEKDATTATAKITMERHKLRRCEIVDFILLRGMEAALKRVQDDLFRQITGTTPEKKNVHQD